MRSARRLAARSTSTVASRFIAVQLRRRLRSPVGYSDSRSSSNLLTSHRATWSDVCSTARQRDMQPWPRTAWETSSVSSTHVQLMLQVWGVATGPLDRILVGIATFRRCLPPADHECEGAHPSQMRAGVRPRARILDSISRGSPCANFGPRVIDAISGDNISMCEMIVSSVPISIVRSKIRFVSAGRSRK